MKNHDRFDDEVRALVGSVGRGVPPALEKRLRAAAEAPLPRPPRHRIRRPLLFVSLAGVSAVLLAVIFIIPALRVHKPSQISEIRTEFRLADKDITIIFVQKPDFPTLVTAF
jgi:hypothetical protein